MTTDVDKGGDVNAALRQRSVGDVKASDRRVLPYQRPRVLKDLHRRIRPHQRARCAGTLLSPADLSALSKPTASTLCWMSPAPDGKVAQIGIRRMGDSTSANLEDPEIAVAPF